MITTKITKYYAIALINFQSRLAYIADLLSEIPIIMLRLWIFKQFYSVTYQMAGVEKFDGMNLVEMIWSLMFIQCFSASASPTLSQLIDEEIKSGSFAYSINKPYSYLAFHYVGYLGRTVPNLIISLISCSIVTAFLVGPISFSWSAIIGGLFLMVLGYSLNFLIELMIGLLALWIEDTSSITWLYHKSVQLLGGSILSISLFPDALKKIVAVLPFNVLFASAAHLLVSFDWSYFFSFFITQLVWLTVTGACTAALWKKGIRNVSISGG